MAATIAAMINARISCHMKRPMPKPKPNLIEFLRLKTTSVFWFFSDLS